MEMKTTSHGKKDHPVSPQSGQETFYMTRIDVEFVNTGIFLNVF